MNKLYVLVWVGLLALSVAAGTIEGSVEIKSAIKERPTGARRRYSLPPGAGSYDSDPRRATRRSDQVLNVVVYLEKAGGEKDRRGTFRMGQKGLEFTPFVLPIQAGSKVDFVNDDIVFHAVYSDSPAKDFLLPEYPKGTTRTVLFDKPGIVNLFCTIHTHMNAYVLVLENGYFTVPTAEHHYQLSDVPAGKYILKAWHPLLDTVSKRIEIKGKEALTVDFNL